MLTTRTQPKRREIVFPGGGINFWLQIQLRHSHSPTQIPLFHTRIYMHISLVHAHTTARALIFVHYTHTYIHTSFGPFNTYKHTRPQGGRQAL
jgi:hypothetical protein